MSSYDDCFQNNNIWYCKRNNIFIVGNNETDYSNAIVSQPLQSEITIPYSVYGHAIKEVGKNAFRECSALSRVNIRAKIYQINQFAFCRCKRLEEIIIPATCLYIFQWGIQTWDSTQGQTSPNPYKSLNVIFKPFSKLQLLQTHAISYRENLNIFFCNNVNPVVDQKAFYRSKNVNFYSPESFVFNGKETIKYDSQYCHEKVTYNTIRKTSVLFVLSIFLCIK